MDRITPLHLSDLDTGDFDKTFTVPDGSTYLVNSIRVEYTASADAATRVLNLLITDGAGDVVLGYLVANADIVASDVMIYNFYESAATVAPVDNTSEGTQALPYRLRLPGGYKIRIHATLGEVADAMLVHVLVEEQTG